MSTASLNPSDRDREQSGTPPFTGSGRDPPTLSEASLGRPKLDDLPAKEPCECPRCGEVSCRCHLLQYSLYPGLYNPLPAPGLLSTVDPSYRMKNGVDSWRALYQTVSYCSSSQHLNYHPYSDPNLEAASSRRKNATRESTSTLKAWLHEHLKNPYPTKGEKIMLAIITKMTLTQVSTWFANARRRLKKENKMTWSARHRSGEESDNDEEEWKSADVKFARFESPADERLPSDDDDELRDIEVDDEKWVAPYVAAERAPSQESVIVEPRKDLHQNAGKENETKNEAITKPKIWSLVDTATSVSPKPKPQNTAPGYISIFPTYLSYLLPTYHSFLGPYYKAPPPDIQDA